MSGKTRKILDPSGGDLVAVLTWLGSNPVPGGPSPELERWRRQAGRLGPKAISALLHALEFGPTDIQYAAQVVLRQLGAEVWAHGYGDDLFYTARVPGKPERHIKPVLRDVTPIEPLEENPTRVGEGTVPYGDDPIERIKAAGQAIVAQRENMSVLARIRSDAVRELIESGLTRAEIARRLGVHPNYVNQLARRRPRISSPGR